MKRTIISIAMALLLASIAALSGCAAKADINLPSYAAIETLPADYTAEDAAADGCVVVTAYAFDMANEDIWAEFLLATQQKTPAAVRVVNLFDDDPMLYIMDLSFDGKRYTAVDTDGNECSFRYMNHYANAPGPLSIASSEFEHYILTDDKTLTLDQLMESLVSSQASFIKWSYVYVRRTQ